MRRVFFAIFVVACGSRTDISEYGNTPVTPPSPSCSSAVLATSSGPSVDDLELTQQLTPYSELSIQQGYLYWVSYSPGTAPKYPGEVATISRVPVTGGAIQSIGMFGAAHNEDMLSRVGAIVGFDDDAMYWADQPIGFGPGEPPGSIVRANLDGSQPTTIIGGVPLVAGVGVFDHKVYFGSSSSLKRANGDGTNVEVVDASEGWELDGSFVANADAIYTPGGLGVRRLQLGGTFTPFVTVPSSLSAGLAIAGDTGVLVSPATTSSETVWRWSTVSGTLVSLATGIPFSKPSPNTLVPDWWHAALDATNAYVNSADSILRIPLGGGAPVTIGKTANTAGIALDDTRVYWISWTATTMSVMSACK